jgi:hypothetical protein
MRHSLLLFTALSTGAATLANAQKTACDENLKLPPVGRWVEYQSKFKNDAYTMRYAVIGTEKREGKEMTWLEMRMEGAKQDRNMIYQVLIPSAVLDPSQAQEIIFKPGDKQAMKVNGMMMKMVRSSMEKGGGFNFSDACNEVAYVGEEKVSVPAGSFKARHFRSDKHATDTWVSTDIPFGMVKSVGKEHEMVLADQGDGAKSSITETPQEMPGMR